MAADSPYYVLTDDEEVVDCDSYDHARYHARYLADTGHADRAEVWSRGVFPDSKHVCVYRAVSALDQISPEVLVLGSASPRLRLSALADAQA